MTRPQILEDTRFPLLRMRQENPEISQCDLAKVVGCINYVLSLFRDRCLVKLGDFKSARDKRRYAYVLTRTGMAERTKLTRSFGARNVAEYEALHEEIEATMPESKSSR